MVSFSPAFPYFYQPSSPYSHAIRMLPLLEYGNSHDCSKHVDTRHTDIPIQSGPQIKSNLVQHVWPKTNRNLRNGATAIGKA